MAAPSVTRPPAVVSEEENAAQSAWMTEMTAWAKWIVLAAIVIAVVGLAVVAIATLGEQSRVTALRGQWDQVYSALKGKDRIEDQQAALEGVAEKVKGSPAHAYVLQRLGDIHFDLAQKPTTSPEERAKYLDRSIELYKVLADNEPYKSSLLYGPLSVQNLALGYEQKQDYEAAIKLLEERLPKLENNAIYFKLSAQLGRVYWLQSVKTNDAKLRTAAREKLAEVLRATQDRSDGGLWREQAAYIKSLVDGRGKALPEGTAIPAAKKPEEKKAETPAPGAPVINLAPKGAPNVVPTTKPAEKAQEPQKTEPKKDGSKDEPKKTGSLNETPANAGVSSSGHASFKQMMDMAKSGRMSFCQCPRCGPNGSPLAPTPFE